MRMKDYQNRIWLFLHYHFNVIARYIAAFFSKPFSTLRLLVSRLITYIQITIMIYVRNNNSCRVDSLLFFLRSLSLTHTHARTRARVSLEPLRSLDQPSAIRPSKIMDSKEHMSLQAPDRGDYENTRDSRETRLVGRFFVFRRPNRRRLVDRA